MTEIQMAVTTASGTVEGAWERVDGNVRTEQAAEGLGAAMENPNGSIGLITDDGIVLIPHRAVEHVRVRTRNA